LRSAEAERQIRESVAHAAQRRASFDAWTAELAYAAVELGPELSFDRLQSVLERFARELSCDRATVAIVDGGFVTYLGVVGAAFDGAALQSLANGRDRVAARPSLVAAQISTRRGDRGCVVFARDPNAAPVAWQPDDVPSVGKLADTLGLMLDQRRLDAQVRESGLLFRLLTEESTEAVLLLDRAGTVAYASPSSVEVLGRTSEQLLDTELPAIIDAVDRAQLVARLAEARERAEIVEVRLPTETGTKWLAVTLRQVIGELPDELVGRARLRASVRDVTQLRKLQDELQRQATHDPLTGLANRELLQGHLQLAASRRARPNDIALLLLDLDGFKAINDRMGHAAGDQVLVTVARRLETLKRPSDTLARLGGDEFVLLCPETDVEGAASLADRIVEAVGAPIPVHGETVFVGASVGIASSTGEVSDPDRLLLLADSAMYDAKRAGKGRGGLAGAA
jgi:diguanylate cyclase (GGDEF)-like protein/PAS domain S-box-containing protein